MLWGGLKTEGKPTEIEFVADSASQPSHYPTLPEGAMVDVSYLFLLFSAFLCKRVE
ncbi:MAG: hypothetical protein GWN58_04185 [Anaerolineae bacterium]|nr:hypothetical protein [Anaerolineae bacterium]